MNETTVTVVGNLVDDPRMRTTDGGLAVAGFRVASTARKFDKDTGRWVDSASLFLSVTCWRQLAGNVVASLRKGDPVVVTGKLSTRTYEKDGHTRSVAELEALAVGPDLSRGTAVFRRAPRPSEDAAAAGPGRGAAGGPEEPTAVGREPVGAGV